MKVTTAKAGKPSSHSSGKKHEVVGFHVRKAAKGFISETHFKRPEGKNPGDWTPAPTPEEMPHQTIDDAAAHMIKTLGGKSAKAAGSGSDDTPAQAA
jgi:hypothetical protein